MTRNYIVENTYVIECHYHVHTVPNTDYFTIEVYYGGSFFDKLNNITYKHGMVLYMNFVHLTFLTSEMLNKIIKACGSNKQMELFYKKPRISLGKGLYRINNEQDVKKYAEG